MLVCAYILVKSAPEDKTYCSQVKRFGQLEDFAFEAYIDFVGKASRAFSVAGSDPEIDHDNSQLEEVELRGNWKKQYFLDSLLEEAREAGDRFTDFFRILDEETSPETHTGYTASEASKVHGVCENLNRLDAKYRSIVLELENLQQQTGPEREHDRPEIDYTEASYEEIMNMASSDQEKASTE